MFYFVNCCLSLYFFACPSPPTEREIEDREAIENRIENNAPKPLQPQTQSNNATENSKNRTKTDPLQNKSLFEICKSDSLSLIRWSFKERQSKVDCCSNQMTESQKKELFCEYDWPEEGTPCSEYDRVRNEIYAQYGKPFSDKKWSQYFSRQSWYSPTENFSEDWLNPTAKNNVLLLLKMKKQKYRCSE